MKQQKLWVPLEELRAVVYRSKREKTMARSIPRIDVKQLFALVFSVSMALAFAPISAAQVASDEEAIIEVVNALANAFNARDADTLYSLLSSQSQDLMTKEDLEPMLGMGYMTVEIIEVRITEITDISARASVTVILSYPDPYGNPISEESTDEMYFVKEAGEWKFHLAMPMPPEEIVIPIPEEAENANLTKDEAIELSRTHPDIAAFLQRHPDAEVYAFYDSYSRCWFVGFMNEKAYAHAIVDDETGGVYDVYVYEWPPAGTNLTEDQVLGIAQADVRVSGFLAAHPDAHVEVWYDEWMAQWYVDCWDEATFEFIGVVIDDATGEIVEIWPKDVSANLTSEQAIGIAKQHELVQEFLADHPDAMEFAYYDSVAEEWWVTFTATYGPLENELPTDWYMPEMVTVIIDDLTGTIKRVEVYRPPLISEAEAIQIAKGSPEMSEFLAAYPDAEIWAWYDQRLNEWVVTACALEVWKEVTVFVDAQTGEIKTRVAAIDWEQALDLAKAHSEVSEFLYTRVVDSVNIYYDKMSNQWNVNFASGAECVTAVIDAATGEIIWVESFSWAEELEEFPPSKLPLPPIPPGYE